MSKENLHFDDQSKEIASLYLSQCFLKEIENMLSMFLLSCRNTHESLGNLEKALETIAYGSCLHSSSDSLKRPLVF